MFLLLWDDYGWRSDIGGLAVLDGSGLLDPGGRVRIEDVNQRLQARLHLVPLFRQLGTLDFVTARENVVFLGPPGTGKTHLATALAIRACQAGHRLQFATASQWVAKLAEAHHTGRLQDELVRLGRYPLLVVDEVGYIPFEPEAANLFFQLVSSRYERASLIVTSNKPFGRWGEVFGDDVVAAAMIDRLVHHAEVVALKGDSFRLKDRDLGRVPEASNTEV
jgi:DNA replication protein DnaC